MRMAHLEFYPRTLSLYSPSSHPHLRLWGFKKSEGSEAFALSFVLRTAGLEVLSESSLDGSTEVRPRGKDTALRLGAHHRHSTEKRKRCHTRLDLVACLEWAACWGMGTPSVSPKVSWCQSPQQDWGSRGWALLFIYHFGLVYVFWLWVVSPFLPSFGPLFSPRVKYL